MSDEVKQSIIENKWVKYLTLVAKGVGVIGSMNQIPGLSPEKSIIVFFIASTVKDVINRTIDFLDDGKVNGSVK